MLTISPYLPSNMDIDTLREWAECPIYIVDRGIDALYCDSWHVDGYLVIACLDYDTLESYLLMNGFSYRGKAAGRYGMGAWFVNKTHHSVFIIETGRLGHFQVVIEIATLSIYPHELEQ